VSKVTGGGYKAIALGRRERWGKLAQLSWRGALGDSRFRRGKPRDEKEEGGKQGKPKPHEN
jgi:hypothetical protein